MRIVHLGLFLGLATTSACRACSTASADRPRCWWPPTYYYGGKTVDVLGKLRQIVASRLGQARRGALRAGERPLPMPHCAHARGLRRALPLSPVPVRALPFDHPLYIIPNTPRHHRRTGVSSTAGGTLLQHLKNIDCNGDVKPGRPRVLATTCGWMMMWNWRSPRSPPRPRRCSTTARPSPATTASLLRLRRRRSDDALRHLGQVPRRRR